MTAPAPLESESVAVSNRWHGARLWFAIALLVGLPFLFHWRLITPDLADRGSFASGDFSGQHYAPAVYLAQRLAAGQLPLWCPGSYGGYPFLADIQNAALYPLRLLTVLVASPWGFPYLALELEAIVHYSLAGVMLFLFARRLLDCDGAALLAAFAFTFGGYLTGYPAQQLAILESAVWLPLALLCADHAVTGPRMLNPWTLALSLPLALSALAGHPQIAMYSYYLVVAYGLWRRPRWRTVGVLAVGMTLALGLAAAQLLPTAEYSLLSTRAGLTYDEVSAGLPLQEAIQVLLPGAVSGYSPLYVGVLPLLLVAVAVLARPSRAVRFWLAVLIVSFLLALGNQVFLHRLFYLAVPGWRLFRNQERVAFITAFAASMLVGYGAKCLLAGVLTAEERQRLMRATARFLWLLLGLVAVSFLGLVAQGWTGDSRFYWVMAVSVYVLIVAVLAWALLRWWLGAAASAGTFVALASALLLFDLFSVGWRHGFSDDPPETHEEMPAALAAVTGDATGADPYRIANVWRLPGNYGVQFGAEDVGGASPLRLARYDELVNRLASERLWSLMAVRYVLTWEDNLPSPSEVIAAVPAENGETTHVHRLASPGRYAWLVHSVEVVRKDGVLDRLAEADFDPTSTAVVEQPLARSLAPPIGVESVTVADRSPEKVVLSVRATGSALLVLSEMYYPGWQARVDGVPAQVVVADYALRAVPIEAGEHLVEIVYRPATWTVGRAVSLLSLAAVAFGAALCRRPRRLSVRRVAAA